MGCGFCRLRGTYSEFDFVAETISRFKIGSLELISKTIARWQSAITNVWSRLQNIVSVSYVRTMHMAYLGLWFIASLGCRHPSVHKLVYCLLYHDIESWCASDRRRFTICCKCRLRICGACLRITKYVAFVASRLDASHAIL